MRALLPACAYQIIAHILLFFDIFHSLKKIAKKDKPETASITALPGLSFFFFVFIAKSEEPQGVLQSFSLIYIRKTTLRQTVPYKD